MRRWKRLTLVIAACVLGLVAIGMGGVLALNYFVAKGYALHRVRSAAMTLRQAAQVWRGTHSGEACPTPEELRATGLTDDKTPLVDEWGSPFQIVCTPDETTVLSRGPDRFEGTADDIEVPLPASER
jgi:hypothetical protein